MVEVKKEVSECLLNGYGFALQSDENVLALDW